MERSVDLCYCISVRFHVVADAVCINALHFKSFHFTIYIFTFHYAVLQKHMRQREGEKAGNGMRNWAIRKNIAYKDNKHLICLTYGLMILNSWPLFAGFEYGVRAGVQQYTGDLETG